MEGYAVKAEARVQLAETLRDPFCGGDSQEGKLQPFDYDLSAYFHRCKCSPSHHALVDLINGKSPLDLRGTTCDPLLQALPYSQRSSLSDQTALITRLFTLLGDRNPRVVDLGETCLTAVIGDAKGNAENEGCLLVMEMAKVALNGEFAEAIAAVRAIKALVTASEESSWEAFLPFYKEVSGKLAALVHSSVSGAIVAGALELLEAWASLVRAVTQRFECSLSTHFRDLVDDVQTADAVEKVLLATVNGGVLAAADSPDSSVFNSLKATLLGTLTLVFQCLSSERHKWEHCLSFSLLETEPLPPSPFLACISQVLGPYLQTCSALSTCPLSPALSAAVRETVKIATLCLAEPPFAGYFAECCKSLVAGLCLPLLVSTQLERDLGSVQPEEFVRFAIDTCSFHKYQTVKTAASQFLTSICRRVDGALTFTTALLSRLLVSSFSEGSDWSAFSLVESAQGEWSLLRLHAETRAEVALLALAALSEPVLERSDLVRSLTHTISAAFHPLATEKSPLVRARFSLFLEHYLPVIAATDEDLSTLLGVLLACVGSGAEARAVSLQSCHALQSVINRRVAVHRIAPAADSVLKALLAALPGQRDKGAYEAMEDLILLHPDAGLGNFEGVLRSVVAIILRQTAVRHSAPGNNILVTRCWLIVRVLTDIQGALPKYGELLETTLSPLLDFLKNPETIDFEDEIVLIWTAIVSQSHSVSAVTWRLFPMLPLVQGKYEGDFGHLYRLLNALIAHSHDALFDHSHRLETVVNMAITALFALQAGAVRESSQAEGLLILQQLLLTAKPGVLDTALLRIVKSAVRRYSYGCQSTTMKVRVLETILAGFRYSAELTREGLEGQEALFFGEVVTLWHGFGHEYDQKLATVTVLHLLASESVEAPTHSLFAALIRILAHRSAPSPPDSPSSHDSTRVTEETEIYALLSTMFSPLQKVDEIELFRQFVDRAVRTQGRWVECLQSLPEEESAQLSDILHSRRLPVAESRTVVRRIVRAKRRLMG